MFERIAFIKTGWADFYQGDVVRGRHAHISSHGEAHESFNFLRGPGERFYGYMPPIGGHGSVPKPEKPGDWLLIFIAAEEGTGPLTVVGWYERATFESEYRERPEYSKGVPFPTTSSGEKFLYCIRAESATLIPIEERSIRVPSKKIRRIPIVYARGNKPPKEWQEKLASFAEHVIDERSTPNPDRGQVTNKFPNIQQRKAVEEAAIDAVTKWLESKDYEVADKQKLKCGYDLLAIERNSKSHLYVEVKGTIGEQQHFYITRNEWRFSTHPNWRLAIVTKALDFPVVHFLTKIEVERRFDLDPMVFEGRNKTQSSLSIK